MAIQKRYTQQEIKFLKDNAGKISGPAIARQLNRGIGSIRHKARHLSISLRLYGDYHYKTKILDNEIELIRELADHGMSYRKIADKFETTTDYVYQLVLFKKRRGPCAS